MKSVSRAARGRAKGWLDVAMMTTIAALLFGCVSAEFSAMESARADYEACVAESSPDRAECELLHDRLRQAEQRYEANARRAWGCNDASDECPTPR